MKFVFENLSSLRACRASLPLALFILAALIFKLHVQCAYTFVCL